MQVTARGDATLPPHYVPPVPHPEADASDAALTAAEFDTLMARLGPWPARRRVAVAVSGGADSVCLALLTAGWGQPLALIVDHGLRLESAAEARLTAARLAQLGVAHQVLELHGIGKSAAAARAARYAALIEAAGQAGIVDLLLGHHAMDQAETVLMRQRAASGAAGQAGMAAIVHTRSVRLVRPFLGVAPGRLRATLRQAGAGWFEDPSNRNPAYLRSRLRAELLLPGAAEGLLRVSGAAAVVRAEEERRMAAFLAEHVSVFPEGFAYLRPGPVPVPTAALGALIRCIGGADFAPASAAVARVAYDPVPCVLGGVRLLAAGKFGPGLLVVREAAAMAASIPVAVGAVWDSRFRLEAVPPAIEDGGSGGTGTVPPALSLGALGTDFREVRYLTPLPAAVLQTLPVLRRNGVLAAVPHIGYCADGALEGLVASFIPAHPLAGAPFDVPNGGCEADGKPPC